MNESCYSFVPPHLRHRKLFVGAHVIYIWMRHIAYMNESCYSFVPPHLRHRKLLTRATPCRLHMHAPYLWYECVISQIWISCVSYSLIAHHLCHYKLFRSATPCHLHMKASYCIYKCVISLNTWMRHVPPTNGSSDMCDTTSSNSGPTWPKLTRLNHIFPDLYVALTLSSAPLCDRNSQFAQHDSFICVTRHHQIFSRRMCLSDSFIISFVWQPTFICATWLMHMYIYIYTYIRTYIYIYIYI